LGSIRAVTDKEGKKVWSADYLAFGKQFGEEKNSDYPDFEELHSFTGKEYEPDTGLHYYNARWYDSDLGRFISEDPVADPNNPNLYSYTANNPLRWIDPTGLDFSDDWAAQDESDTENTSNLTEDELTDIGYYYTGYLYGDPTITAPPVEGVTITYTENSDGTTTMTITTKKETGIAGITGTSSYSYTFNSDGKVIIESEHITFINQDGQTITVITTNNYDKVTQTYTLYDKEGNVVDSSTNVYDYKAGESPLYSFENPGSGRLKSKEEGNQKLMFSIKGMDKAYQLDYRVAFAYLSMVAEARIYGIDAPSLGLWSAYRSDKRQKELWDDRVKELLKDPKWAAIAKVDKNAFEKEVARGVARPGTGPHRTGRAVDLNIEGMLNKLWNAAAERKTDTFQWLQDNASRFGFYNYYDEPWHWEYNPKSY
ncbi:MAG: hypothetical protein GX075_11095, partial [Firmicutes bacterium]|nr:hypothetical protein [Bacillota bacterium]